MSRHEQNADLSALERDLRALAPSSGGLSRDVLLFRAGQAAARRSGFWPAAAGLMTVAAVSLGSAWMLRPTPEPVVRVEQVYITGEVPVPPLEPRMAPPPPEREAVPTFDSATATEPADYLRLREQVVRWGADVLPAPHAAAPQGSWNGGDLGIPLRDQLDLERPDRLRPGTAKKLGGPL